MIKKVYFYRLTDAKGDQTITVVDDPSDNGTIGDFHSIQLNINKYKNNT